MRTKHDPDQYEVVADVLANYVEWEDESWRADECGYEVIKAIRHWDAQHTAAATLEDDLRAILESGHSVSIAWHETEASGHDGRIAAFADDPFGSLVDDRVGVTVEEAVRALRRAIEAVPE